jgi:hypothetical protein
LENLRARVTQGPTTRTPRLNVALPRRLVFCCDEMMFHIFLISAKRRCETRDRSTV